MNYLIAIISGLAFGSVVAVLKHLLVWRPYAAGRADNLATRSIISSAVNVGALLVVFFMRDIWPYSFAVTLLAVAVGLSTAGKLTAQASAKKMQHTAVAVPPLSHEEQGPFREGDFRE